MAKHLQILILSLLASTSLTLISSVHSSGADHFAWLPTAAARSGCQGSIAECALSEDDEFEMDSEINRRILATSSYISYGALQKNRVPCSRRGASYYNCQSGAQANPYSRGCSAITRCRS